MYNIARLLVFSVLPYLIISDKRRYTTNKRRYATLTSDVKKDVGEYCSDNSHCLNNDCRGNRCGGRAEGQWCSENDMCSDRNCYRGACHGNDAYKDIGDSCDHKRECISTRCSDGTCVGRTNGSWCQKSEWCASNHCFKSRCQKKPFDPCSSRSTAQGCNGDCAWSNGQCAYSECHVWCGNHQAPSCQSCPSGHGDSWCKGNCAWYNGTCLSVSDLPDPCNAIDDAKKCIGECAWSDGVCSFSETHVNCGDIADAKKCIGECAWSNGVCSFSETHVNCGEHQAPSCSLCPSGHGESWCSGECSWLNGECLQDVVPDGTVSQSSDEYPPWWKVDFNKINILRIVIWNKSDCCMWHLSNAVVRIYSDDHLGNPRPAHWTSIGDMSNKKVKVINYSNVAGIGIYGNTVKVEFQDSESLQSAEVQVFGKPIVW